MKTILTFMFILYLSFGKAQSVEPVDLNKSDKSALLVNSNYGDIWDSYFKPTISQNKNFYPHPSTFSVSYHVEPFTGMFCKMEYKIETKSILSPRFRLGSLNYTNWLEGKGEFYTRYWK